VKRIYFLITIVIVLLIAAIVFVKRMKAAVEGDFVSYVVDPVKEQLDFYLENEEGKNYSSIGNLKLHLEKQDRELLFAMNGGMYHPDQSPVGLYIEKGEIVSPVNRDSGSGNFYLQPNGIFYVDKNMQVEILPTNLFYHTDNIAYATQSGPMLVIDGVINPAFSPSSGNRNIRNGVGILPGNKALFAMSKRPVSFYAFATYFKNKGCLNALYFDGIVSRTYLPAKGWTQLDGAFGVIIATTARRRR
jgi:uncharacterized protein YigE (DUF2233 family)